MSLYMTQKWAVNDSIISARKTPNPLFPSTPMRLDNLNQIKSCFLATTPPIPISSTSSFLMHSLKAYIFPLLTSPFPITSILLFLSLLYIIQHNNNSHNQKMKPIICFLLLISALACANSARILDETVGPQAPLDTTVPPDFAQSPIVPPEVPADVQPPVVGPPEVLGTPTDVLPPVVPPVVTTTAPADVPEAVTPPVVDPSEPPVVPPVVTPEADVPPVVGPPVGAVTPPVMGTGETPVLSFFMHDVLGGSQASGRVVTGIVATSDSSNIPFSKANNQAFPISGGVPLFNNQVNSIVNNNNAPLLAAMNSQQLQQQQQSVIQNAGNNNNVVNGGGSSQAFVTAGQLPQGASLQELMFGSITVIDDEITEGHELGTGVIGSAQGFYLASSLDGASHTMVWTALFHGGEHGVDGTISFFGVHRPASPVSYVAVIGGTGKYENAKGYASIESVPQVDQYTTDGVETIVHISVFLS
ncbi:uncharacterized protein [Phyllobates terribilis]|uniref:uncharacterized protein n=1 Tax=Phyllobates terribilis TaxID=111132 RepID=UPI003CCA70F4